jgi:hypothetical protein
MTEAILGVEIAWRGADEELGCNGRTAADRRLEPVNDTLHGFGPIDRPRHPGHPMPSIGRACGAVMGAGVGALAVPGSAVEVGRCFQRFDPEDRVMRFRPEAGFRLLLSQLCRSRRLEQCRKKQETYYRVF